MAASSSLDPKFSEPRAAVACLRAAGADPQLEQYVLDLAGARRRGAQEFAAELGRGRTARGRRSGAGIAVRDILDGHNSSLADGVRRALGREANDFTEYVRRTVATGAWRV
jgi:hypothetical protein